VKRKIDYIGWARKTVEGLRGANESLEKQFDEAARAAEQSRVPGGGISPVCIEAETRPRPGVAAGLIK
jgi:hypothetical protein